MTQFIHKTNRLSPKPPDPTEIQQGEICLNTYNLGSHSAGINNGRLYIKTDNDEVRRFISLGLPGSNDPSLKTKYGGNNNVFGGVADNSDTGYDSLMVFQYSAAGNHIINKTAANKLTWSSGDNRLNINRSSAAQATVHIGGDVCVDTVNSWSTTFTSNFQIIGRDIGDNNRLKQVSSVNLLALTPTNTIPANSISGTIPVTKGGTGADITSLSPVEGSLLYYSVSASRFGVDSDIKWDSTSNLLILTGGFEFNPPADTLNNASPVGVDGSNRIVRMDYTYDQNLRTTDSVEFSKLLLTGFSAADNFVIQNIYDEAGAKFLGINSDGEVVRIGSFSTDQNLATTSNITFNKLTINNSLSATDAFVFNNMPVSSLSSDKIVVLDSSNYLRRTDYSIDQDIRTTDNVEFNKLVLSVAGTDALTITNIQTDATASIIGVNASNQVVEVGYSINQNLRTSDDVNFDKITITGGAGSGDTLVLSSIYSSTGGSALEIDAGGNVYKSSSTRKLKENITDYNKGLNTVLSLNPKYFNMINDPNKTLRAGLIAEDLADLGLDEFVTKDSDDNPIGISYDKLVVLLINAIKELKNQIDNISIN